MNKPSKARAVYNVAVSDATTRYLKAIDCTLTDGEWTIAIAKFRRELKAADVAFAAAVPMLRK